MGFTDVSRALAILAELGTAAGESGMADDDGLLTALGTASDPDLALASLARLVERDQKVLRELRAERRLRNVAPRGGTTKRQLLRDGDDVLELAERERMWRGGHRETIVPAYRQHPIYRLDESRSRR